MMREAVEIYFFDVSIWLIIPISCIPLNFSFRQTRLLMQKANQTSFCKLCLEEFSNFGFERADFRRINFRSE